ncbi:DUF3570 domain-containing protein [Polluticoccus soli]|uniref:DUF3570 domain-containing protein n=1 Tax=Polluticoccus soli TaxID=3034150 RepID=UPI0023E2D487|nr:DUF3570 domain-containing protein [Flavipsychrobacter sp. JY13-12]
MRKLSLLLLALLFKTVAVFAQNDSAVYQKRKLSISEINFVSSYYWQDGNNSAVTGGIGTEQLTDFANTLELKLTGTDGKGRQHTLAGEMGIDHYSSASSDKIDPATISSASHADTRFYPSLSYTLNNDARGIRVGGNLSFSTEFDYTSFGIGANFAKTSADKNRELALKLQAYFDSWSVIYPVELRAKYGQNGKVSGQHDPRDSYSASLSFAQVVNRRLQFAVLADLIYQQGLLATNYQRVYFTDNKHDIERLPDTRFKLPLGLRGSYFLGDRFILRGFYRFYWDDWGITAHTASLEVPVKISSFFSISPFYRYYTQTAADYFAPFGVHQVNEVFYTSDYDLSAFASHFFGAGIRYTPENSVFGIKHLSLLELRYGHYTRNTGLHSDIVTLALGFK